MGTGCSEKGRSGRNDLREEERRSRRESRLEARSRGQRGLPGCPTNWTKRRGRGDAGVGGAAGRDSGGQAGRGLRKRPLALREAGRVGSGEGVATVAGAVETGRERQGRSGRSLPEVTLPTKTKQPPAPPNAGRGRRKSAGWVPEKMPRVSQQEVRRRCPWSLLGAGRACGKWGDSCLLSRSCRVVYTLGTDYLSLHAQPRQENLTHLSCGFF